MEPRPKGIGNIYAQRKPETESSQIVERFVVFRQETASLITRNITPQTIPFQTDTLDAEIAAQLEAELAQNRYHRYWTRLHYRTTNRQGPEMNVLVAATAYPADEDTEKRTIYRIHIKGKDSDLVGTPNTALMLPNTSTGIPLEQRKIVIMRNSRKATLKEVKFYWGLVKRLSKFKPVNGITPPVYQEMDPKSLFPMLVKDAAKF